MENSTKERPETTADLKEGMTDQEKQAFSDWAKDPPKNSPHVEVIVRRDMLRVAYLEGYQEGITFACIMWMLVFSALLFMFRRMNE